MTTPAEFLTYVTQALQFMDTQLAAGSAVLFAPLVDGRVLYNTLSGHLHPAGITYKDMYVIGALFHRAILCFAPLLSCCGSWLCDQNGAVYASHVYHGLFLHVCLVLRRGLGPSAGTTT